MNDDTYATVFHKINSGIIHTYNKQMQPYVDEKLIHGEYLDRYIG